MFSDGHFHYIAGKISKLCLKCDFTLLPTVLENNVQTQEIDLGRYMLEK